jgi:Arc/MetJ family transcription regulator
MVKTTVDLNASLLAEAKARAARDHSTLRDTVEAALRAYLAGSGRGDFRLRDASVDGRGLTDEAAARPASAWVDMTYEGRGT